MQDSDDRSETDAISGIIDNTADQDSILSTDENKEKKGLKENWFSGIKRELLGKENRERNESYIGFLLKVSLIFMAIGSFLQDDWLWGFTILLGAFVCSIPHIVEKEVKIHIPWFLDLSITIAVFLHVGGGYFNLYGTIPGYDHITHSVTCMVISILALITTYMLSRYTETFRLPPVFIGLFVVILTMALGVIWEMMEWGLDHFTEAGTQHGLNDTMWDLVYDSVAGLVVGLIGARMIKTRKIDELVESMEVDIADLLKAREEGKPFHFMDHSIIDLLIGLKDEIPQLLTIRLKRKP